MEMDPTNPPETRNDEVPQIDVLSKLEEIEAHGKYDAKNCTAVLDLWDIFSRIRPETLQSYPLVFKRLVKVVSRTILSGLWAKLKESHMRLRGNVSSVHRFLEQQEALEEEKSQCDAITTLLDVDPWNKQSVRDVLYFQGDTLTPDRIDVVFAEEGWVFLESRLETLTGLPDNLLFPFAEACALKAHAQKSHSYEEKTNSYYDLSLEKYYQVLCFFCVVVAARRRGTNNAILHRKLKPFLTPWTRVMEIINRLLQIGNPNRLQANWKGWKNPEELALEILELTLLNANESETEESELKIVFHNWLSLSLRVKQGAAAQNTNKSLPLQQLTPELPLEISENPNPDERSVKDIPPEKLRTLGESAFKNEYAYNYGDWIVQYFGQNPSTLATCVHLYLTRLSPEVSKFLNIHDLPEERNEYFGLTQSLGFAFKSLSQYFLKDSQLTFEIRLTLFSLTPTREGLDTLQQMTDVVDLRSKLSRSHNDRIGLPPDLFGDFTNILLGARVNRLTCFRDSWEKFWEICEKHLETGGSDIRRQDQLDLVKPTDYSLYEGLKPAYDDDDAGYEAGYLPDEADIANELDGKKPVRIREPKSRMNTYYRQKAAKLKKLAQGSNGTIIQKPTKSPNAKTPTTNGIIPEKRKRGRPVLVRTGDAESNPKLKLKEPKPPRPVKPKSIPPLNGTVQPMKRKYVRKVPYSARVRVPKDFTKGVGGRGKPVKVCRAATTIVELKERRQKEMKELKIKTEHVTSKDGPEGRPPKLHSVVGKRSGSSMTRGAEDSQTNPAKRKRNSHTRFYKCNDTSTVCVAQNQRIYSAIHKVSGVWPSTSEATMTYQGVTILPKLPKDFPRSGSLSTRMPYHESSSIYNVGRSTKALCQRDIGKMISRFMPHLSESVLEKQGEPTSYSYLDDSLQWRIYMGEKLEHELETIPMRTITVRAEEERPMPVLFRQEPFYNQPPSAQEPMEVSQESVSQESQEEEFGGVTEKSPFEHSTTGIGIEEPPQTSVLDLSVQRVDMIPAAVNDNSNLVEENNVSFPAEPKPEPERMEEIAHPDSTIDETLQIFKSEKLESESESLGTIEQVMHAPVESSLLSSDDDSPPPGQTETYHFAVENPESGCAEGEKEIPMELICLPSLECELESLSTLTSSSNNTQATTHLQDVKCTELESKLVNGSKEEKAASLSPISPVEMRPKSFESKETVIPDSFVKLDILAESDLAQFTSKNGNRQIKKKRRRRARIWRNTKPRKRVTRENSAEDSISSSSSQLRENSSSLTASSTPSSTCSSRRSSTASCIFKEVRILLHRVDNNVIHSRPTDMVNSLEITITVPEPVPLDARPDGKDRNQNSRETELKVDEREAEEEEDGGSSVKDGSESPEYVPSGMEESESSGDEESRSSKSAMETPPSSRKRQKNGQCPFQKNEFTTPSTHGPRILKKQITPPAQPNGMKNSFVPVMRRLERRYQRNPFARKITPQQTPVFLNINSNSPESIDLDEIEQDPLAQDETIETVDLVSDEDEVKLPDDTIFYVPVPDGTRSAKSPSFDGNQEEILPDLKNMDCTSESILPDIINPEDDDAHEISNRTDEKTEDTVLPNNTVDVDSLSAFEDVKGDDDAENSTPDKASYDGREVPKENHPDPDGVQDGEAILDSSKIGPVSPEEQVIHIEHEVEIALPDEAPQVGHQIPEGDAVIGPLLTEEAVLKVVQGFNTRRDEAAQVGHEENLPSGNQNEDVIHGNTGEEKEAENAPPKETSQEVLEVSEENRSDLIGVQVTVSSMLQQLDVDLLDVDLSPLVAQYSQAHTDDNEEQEDGPVLREIGTPTITVPEPVPDARTDGKEQNQNSRETELKIDEGEEEEDEQEEDGGSSVKDGSEEQGIHIEHEVEIALPDEAPQFGHQIPEEDAVVGSLLTEEEVLKVVQGFNTRRDEAVEVGYEENRPSGDQNGDEAVQVGHEENLPSGDQNEVVVHGNTGEEKEAENAPPKETSQEVLEFSEENRSDLIGVQVAVSSMLQQLDVDLLHVDLSPLVAQYSQAHTDDNEEQEDGPLLRQIGTPTITVPEPVPDARPNGKEQNQNSRETELKIDERKEEEDEEEEDGGSSVKDGAEEQIIHIEHEVEIALPDEAPQVGHQIPEEDPVIGPLFTEEEVLKIVQEFNTRRDEAVQVGHEENLPSGNQNEGVIHGNTGEEKEAENAPPKETSQEVLEVSEENRSDLIGVQVAVSSMLQQLDVDLLDVDLSPLVAQCSEAHTDDNEEQDGPVLREIGTPVQIETIYLPVAESLMKGILRNDAAGIDSLPTTGRALDKELKNCLPDLESKHIQDNIPDGVNGADIDIPPFMKTRKRRIDHVEVEGVDHHGSISIELSPKLKKSYAAQRSFVASSSEIFRKSTVEIIKNAGSSSSSTSSRKIAVVKCIVKGASSEIFITPNPNEKKHPKSEGKEREELTKPKQSRKRTFNPSDELCWKLEADFPAPVLRKRNSARTKKPKKSVQMPELKHYKEEESIHASFEETQDVPPPILSRQSINRP